MSLPLVSIIIVNYNGRELLEQCLESLSKIDYSSTETILVDNNSTDDSISMVKEKYPKTIILKLDSNKGFAEPNNIGAKIAKGKYLLFLNNDTIVSENFVMELVKVIERDDKIGICQSMLLKPDGTIDSSGDFIDELGVVYNSKTRVNTIREISSARGASMIIRKPLFGELGGFDEKFFATFEDVDLGWRSWIAGYKSLLVPSSIVIHVGGMTIQTIKPEIAFHGFKNQISMKMTNFEGFLAIKNMVLFFAIYGIRELRIWLDYTIHGKTNLTPTPYENKIAQKPSISIIAKSIVWVMSNLQYIIKKHKHVNKSRVCSTQVLKKYRIILNTTQ